MIVSPRLIAGILSSLMLLQGCAPQSPTWTRERAAEVTSRTFSGSSASEVVKAAENVLRLADGNDVVFDYRDDGFSANRSFFVFAVIAAASGSFRFDFAVEPSGNGTKAVLKIYSTSQGTGAAAAPAPGGMIFVPSTQPATSGVLVTTSSSYDLFFSRLAYLLGQGDRWISCDVARDTMAQGVGSLEPLCLAATDQAPQ